MKLSKILALLAWHHPLLDGGERVGINSVGTQIFKLFSQFLIEMGQNTRDAHDGGDEPATIVLRRESVEIASIPGLAEVRERLEMCMRSWSHCPKAAEFFRRALRAFENKKGIIDCLRVSDFNTNGAPGDENDQTSPWYKLARTTGSTGKVGGEGGSHGVGKIAALAASDIRTVYYSSLDVDGNRNFIGTSLLTTYTDDAGLERQNRSFFGGKGGSTVTDPTLIPTILRRDKVGLDILIPAFRFSKDWLDQTVACFGEFFWPAISQGLFEAVIADGSREERVCRDNLHLVLQKHRDKNDAHIYHRIYTDPSKRHDFRTEVLGASSVFVAAGEDHQPNGRFVLIRKNGIVIDSYRPQSRVKVSGVFECSNDKGNEILRRMEPPCHDEWNPKWMDDDAPLGRKAESEYKRCIREAVEKITFAENAETGSVTGLENLLPMEGGGPGGKGSKPVCKKPRRVHAPKAIAREATYSRNRTKKSIKITPLAARAVDASKGTYKLKIDHPEGTENAHITIGIAGDAGDAGLASIRKAKDEFGKTAKVSDDRLSFGPVKLKKGTSSFEVKTNIKNRVSLRVYARHEN